MEHEPLETMEAHGDPVVRQQSVFVENRVGQLLRLTSLFNRTDIRILAISIVNSVDCAIARMILDEPDRAYEVLRDARFQISETDLIVVSLPHGKRALLQTWAALLGAEINIYYTYPLLIQPRGHAAIALLPDNIEHSVKILNEKGFDVLDETDLRDAASD